MYIYHYFIDYDKNTITIKQESYEELSNNRIRIHSIPNRTLSIKNIGILLNHRTVFLFERNDELVLNLFNLYMDNKIQSLENDLNRFRNLKTLIDNKELVEVK